MHYPIKSVAIGYDDVFEFDGLTSGYERTTTDVTTCENS